MPLLNAEQAIDYILNKMTLDIELCDFLVEKYKTSPEQLTNMEMLYLSAHLWLNSYISGLNVEASNYLNSFIYYYAIISQQNH